MSCTFTFSRNPSNTSTPWFLPKTGRHQLSKKSSLALFRNLQTVRTMSGVTPAVERTDSVGTEWNALGLYATEDLAPGSSTIDEPALAALGTTAAASGRRRRIRLSHVARDTHSRPIRPRRFKSHPRDRPLTAAAIHRDPMRQHWRQVTGLRRSPCAPTPRDLARPSPPSPWMSTSDESRKTRRAPHTFPGSCKPDLLTLVPE
jgi:hypothetical protein